MTKRYFVFFFLLFLAACVGNLDTTNKRFAAFEISYKQTLVQIESIEKADGFKPETRLKVAELLKEVNKARNLAYMAKDSGDILKAQDGLSLAIAALDKLKLMIPQGGKI